MFAGQSPRDEDSDIIIERTRAGVCVLFRFTPRELLLFFLNNDFLLLLLLRKDGQQTRSLFGIFCFSRPHLFTLLLLCFRRFVVRRKNFFSRSSPKKGQKQTDSRRTSFPFSNLSREEKKEREETRSRAREGERLAVSSSRRIERSFPKRRETRQKRDEKHLFLSLCRRFFPIDRRRLREGKAHFFFLLL